MRMEELKFIDLFAGIGGFRQALEKFGATCVFSSEKDKFANITYEKNYGEKPKGDITKIKEDEIPEHDILCAGFPCQPFSVSGKQRGFEDERGIHFFEIYRIAKYHKPKIMFLENVANLKRHNDSQTIKRMEDMLKELGYKVFVNILNASDYNVPQSRKRIYFVCFKESELPINNFEFPSKVEPTLFLEDVLQSDDETEKYRIVRDDIILKDINVDKNDRKPIRIGTINKGGQGDRIYSTKGHAITLSAEGGGAGAKTGAYLINGYVRKLSPRECARVQGFPEEFIIPVTDNQAYKQFGNSVALPVLCLIVEKINETLINYYNSKIR
jgi:DNA (cytosine-5)-methyltransferase 1